MKTVTKQRGRKRNPIYYTDGVFDPKKWEAANADKYLTQITCTCGSVVQKRELKRHQKSMKHRLHVLANVDNNI